MSYYPGYQDYTDPRNDYNPREPPGPSNGNPSSSHSQCFYTRTTPFPHPPIHGPRNSSPKPTVAGSYKRRSRTVFSTSAVKYLEEQFISDDYPTYGTRCVYASKIGITEERVQVWFSNKRARNKRKAKQLNNTVVTSRHQIRHQSPVTSHQSSPDSSTIRSPNFLPSPLGAPLFLPCATEELAMGSGLMNNAIPLSADFPEYYNNRMPFSQQPHQTANNNRAKLTIPATALPPPSSPMDSNCSLSVTPTHDFPLPQSSSTITQANAQFSAFQFPPPSSMVASATSNRYNRRKPSNLRIPAPDTPSLNTPRFNSRSPWPLFLNPYTLPVHASTPQFVATSVSETKTLNK